MAVNLVRRIRGGDRAAEEEFVRYYSRHQSLGGTYWEGAARKALWEAYGWFVAAFREAAEKLKVGDRDAAFPTRSFPPGLPFVTA